MRSASSPAFISMHCQRIENANLWNAFVDEQRPHTFLQSWNWGAFQEREGTRIFRLGLFEGATLVAVALALCIRARRGSFIFCPHGPILSSQADPHTTFECLTHELARLAREQHCAFVRVSPLLPASADHQTLFASLGFRPAPIHMHPELAWMLDLAPSEDELLKQMRKTTRHNIRKAEEEGVEVTVSEEPEALENFWRVYQTTVDRQNFTPFSRAYLSAEIETFGRDHQALIATGIYQNEIISSAIIIFAHGSAFYHHGASDNQRFPKIPAAHLLQWRLIQEAKRRGCHWYNFWGVSPENQPRHPWAGLSLFKRGFGGQAEAYLHAQDLMLSPRYWLTFGVDIIRKWKRGV